MDQSEDKKNRAGMGQINYVGIAILLVIVSFIIGNRWNTINQRFNEVTTNNSEQAVAPAPGDLDYGGVEQVYDLLRSKYDGELSEQELVEGLKKGLVDAAGDKYTVYLSPKDAEEFNADLNGTFSGIGAELGVDDDGRLIIVAPLSGFPAEAAGLRAQDIIAQIDGEDSLHISVEEAVSKIRGEEGTDVTLTVIRDNQPLEITITRKLVVVPSVESEILENNVGYMKVSRFAEDTSALARKVAEEFKAKNVSSVILDVRNNSGGYLQSAVDLAGLWVENQVVVDQRRGDASTGTLKAGNNAPLKGVSTKVLINAGSASASEIVAGALQDLGAAQLIGTNSFGKGSVQSLEQLPDGGVLKVTIARWYTPKGNNIDKDGIKPDVKVEITDEDFKAERDPQLERAIQDLAQ